MKVLVALLVCSLAANATYLFVRGFPSSPASPPPSAATAPASAVSPAAQRDAIAALFDPARTDAATLQGHLDAAGFPPEVVRAVAMVQVQQDYKRRQLAVIHGVETPPFWKTSSGFGMEGVLSPEQERELNALRREREARLRELSGGAFFPEELDSVTAEQRWGPIPAEKIAAVRRIEGDYGELQRELLGGRPPFNLPAAELEKLALLNRERRADIASVLTPEELFEYDLRQGPTASRLRSQLAAFQPTEEEFRALFKVQFALDQASGRDVAYAGVMYTSSADRDADRAAQLAQMKPLLPPERFAEFEFATDNRNGTLARIANRFGVSSASAREVATIRDATSQEMLNLRRNTSLDKTERDARLAELTQSAAARVSGALGPAAYRAYLENGGAWLNPPSVSTSRPTTPPAP